MNTLGNVYTHVLKYKGRGTVIGRIYFYFKLSLFLSVGAKLTFVEFARICRTSKIQYTEKK